MTGFNTSYQYEKASSQGWPGKIFSHPTLFHNVICFPFCILFRVVSRSAVSVSHCCSLLKPLSSVLLDAEVCVPRSTDHHFCPNGAFQTVPLPSSSCDILFRFVWHERPQIGLVQPFCFWYGIGAYATTLPTNIRNYILASWKDRCFCTSLLWRASELVGSRNIVIHGICNRCCQHGGFR